MYKKISSRELNQYKQRLKKKQDSKNISRLTTINIIVSPLVLSAFQIIRDQKFCCPEKQYNPIRNWLYGASIQFYTVAIHTVSLMRLL